jgi:hypothetical protein
MSSTLILLLALSIILSSSLFILIMNLMIPSSDSSINMFHPTAEALQDLQSVPFPCQDAAVLITSLTIDNGDSGNTTVVAGTPITLNLYLDSIEQKEGNNDDMQQEVSSPPRQNATVVLQIVDSSNVAVAIAMKEIDLPNIHGPQTVSSITLTEGILLPGNYSTNVFLVSSISHVTIPEVLTPIQKLEFTAVDDHEFSSYKTPMLTPLRSDISSSKNATEQPNSLVLYDDFEGDAYTLDDGEYSPNCKWQSIHDGYGKMGVRVDEDDADKRERNNVFFEVPAPASGPSKVNPDNKSTSGTHAGLALTTLHNYKNFHLALDVKTKMQLREGLYPPNPWETAWIMFNYLDKSHHYYFILTPNGIELGKKDNNMQVEQQIDLISRENPRGSIGSWQHIDLVVNENHFLTYVNGSKVLDYIDENMSKERFGSGGAIGLYCEDAEGIFDSLYIARLP